MQSHTEKAYFLSHCTFWRKELQNNSRRWLAPSVQLVFLEWSGKESSWEDVIPFFDFLLVTSKTGGWTRSTHQIRADSTICSTTVEISLSVPGESIHPTLERHRTAASSRSQQGLSQSLTCCYFSTSMLFILVLLTRSVITLI